MNRRAEISVLTKAIFAILVLVVLIYSFTNLLRNNDDSYDRTTNECGPAGDFDGDLTLNSFDACPCDKDNRQPCTTDADACSTKMSNGCDQDK